VVLRLHTFLFADLVGFTGFTVRHGDERAADVAISFQRAVSALAAEHGCEVVKSIGDGMLLRSEDGGAALGVARRIVQLAAEAWLPAVRVGLDTGPAARRGDDWFGSTVNTASRVTSAARPGELLMTERTREACPDETRARLRGRGRRRLDGLPEDHALFGDGRSRPGAVASTSDPPP
jgi:adenylate cyclase